MLANVLHRPPSIANQDALLISVGIVGATVMPHAIYVHSGLMPDRIDNPTDHEKSKLIKYSNLEVIIALSIAGMVNMAMVIMAAGAFHSTGHIVTEIEDAYKTLWPLLGGAAAVLYLTSLLMSGISSSVVGTMAGQMIMQGFVGFNIPIWLRRAITITPSFIVVALGYNTTQLLVISQVVLSLALPIPVIALYYFTRSEKVMGRFANSSLVNILSVISAVIILVLNVVLIYQTLTGN